MATQLLVNVISVTVPAAGTMSFPHGLSSCGRAVAPTNVVPDRITPLAVTAISPTDITVHNETAVPCTANFRVEAGLSLEVNAPALTPFLWQGGAVGGGGAVASVTFDAPLKAAGTLTNPIGTLDFEGPLVVTPGGKLTLAAGAAAGGYGGSESIPTFTLDAYGRVITAVAVAPTIDGVAAKTYVDTAASTAESNAKAYAQTLAFSIASKDAAHVATALALPGPYTVSSFGGETNNRLTKSTNGALGLIDGHAVVVGDRVLVKDEAGLLAPNNGLYVVTQLGNGTTPWILTRSTDADTATELCGSIVSVENGTQAGTVWTFTANSATFSIGVDNVTWVQLSMRDATTLATGGVQLAGGLGGAGTAAVLPKLDMAHATSGTLAIARGGTGLASAGVDATKYVKAKGDGTFELAGLPTFTAPAYAVIYVAPAPAGNDSNDGSISAPLATIAAAQTKATTLYGATAPVVIQLAPGSYIEAVTLTRLNTFLHGYGCQPDERAATLITQPLVVTPAAGGSIYNYQIGIEGCFISAPSAGTNAAFTLNGSNAASVLLRNCYLYTANDNANAHAVNASNSACKLVVIDCVLNVQGAAGTVNAHALNLAGLDSKISGVQTLQGAAAFVSGTGRAVNMTGTATALIDRALITTGTNVAPVKVSGSVTTYAKLSMANSTISGSQSSALEFDTTGSAASAPFAGLLTNVGMLGLGGSCIIEAAGAAAMNYVAYSNLSSISTLPLLLSDTAKLTLVRQPSHVGSLYLDGETASLPLKLDASKKAIAQAIALGGTEVTGTLPATKGGTGNAVYAIGDLLYADTTTVLARRAIGSEGMILRVPSGLNPKPTWAYSAGVTGTKFQLSGIDVGVAASVLPTNTAAISVNAPVLLLTNSSAITPNSSPSQGPQFAFAGAETPQAGARVTVVQTGAGSTTFNDETSIPGSGIQLGGVSQRTLLQYQSIDFVFDGTYWIERAVGGSGVVQAVLPDEVTAGLGLVSVGGATALPKVGIRGLTGDNPGAIGCVVYFDTTKTLTKTSTGAAYQPLVWDTSVPGAPKPVFQALALNQAAATSGILPTSKGGTGVGTGTLVAAKKVFAGPTDGNPDALPDFRLLAAADLPTIPASKLSGNPYDMSVMIYGVPEANREVFRFSAVRNCLLKSGTHRATCQVAPTSNTSFTIKATISGVTSTIGTLTILALAYSGTLTLSPAVDVAFNAANGDYLTVETGASVNGISNVSITFLAEVA